MKHARADYNRFQDPAGLIPEDEPVFLIRAQDVASAYAVRAWADFNDALGGSSKASQVARDHANRMAVWTPKKRCDLPGES